MNRNDLLLISQKLCKWSETVSEGRGTQISCQSEFKQQRSAVQTSNFCFKMSKSSSDLMIVLHIYLLKS